VGEVAEAAEVIIWETCKELDIEIIDMAVNVDHVPLFIKYPPKYSVSGIAKRLKGRSRKQTLLEKAFTEKCFAVRDRFPQLKELCPGQFYADFPKGNQILQSKIGQYWAPSCYHGSVGHGGEVVERYISGQKGYEKTDTVPVIAEEKEKLRAHKTWYISLYNKLFGEKHQK
jgi:putative transposase